MKSGYRHIDTAACYMNEAWYPLGYGYREADYPAEGEDLTVVGAYDLYEEDGYQYCILKDAVLE